MPRTLLCIAALLLSTIAMAADIHVAPSGNDQAAGTAAAPFATIDRAKQATRDLLRKGVKEEIRVVLNGEFQLTQPIVLEPADSGTAAAPIVYTSAPGRPAVISGGRSITGWKQDGKFWTVEIADVKAGKWKFNQLFVNGQARPRARTPNEGFLRVAACPEGTPKTANYHKDCQSFQFAPGDLRADWTNLHDVEVIVYHFWTDSHLPIQSINPEKNLVVFAHKAGKVFTDDFTENGARYVVDNVFEGLDQPGEWYLNRRTGVLYYLPKPGETLGQVEFVAPVAPALLELRGRPTQGQFVEHVAFRNIVFQYTNFSLPPGNSNDQQGSASVTAAVALVGARHCRFEQCSFTRLGNWGVDLSRGCADTVFAGNDVGYVAAGGFRVNGGNDQNSPVERTARITLEDNHVHHYGQVYPSAVGILLMHAEGCRVVHNDIHDGYYTGVSIGWVWGYGRSVSRDNEIAWNHIHHIGHGLLSDMGGIYTLGVSPGTALRSNLIHDVDANQYGGWGIYFDEGTTHILAENNVVYRTKFAPFNIHFAKETTVRNNIFALGRLEQASRGRMEPHKSVYFENNIVYWREGELFSKNWKDSPYDFYRSPIKGPGKTGLQQMTSTFDCDWNLYFNPTLKLDAVKFNGGTWAEWQKRGKDRNSLYADPKFADPDKGDFRLTADSPALKLGFRPVDLTGVGPRRSAGAK